jgi:hypothetical protein
VIPVRREDVAVLAAFERDQSGRTVFPEAAIERLLAMRFLEMRGGLPILTTRGRTELLRRKALDRESGRR